MNVIDIHEINPYIRVALRSVLKKGYVMPYTLSWQWPFEGDDAYDTMLGNLEEDLTLTIVIETYAEYMHTVFNTDRMLAILDEMVAEIRDEMPRQCERWGAMSYSRWESNIERLHTIIRERWDYSKGDLQETFGLSDAYMKELFPEDA